MTKDSIQVPRSQLVSLIHGLRCIQNFSMSLGMSHPRPECQKDCAHYYDELLHAEIHGLASDGVKMLDTLLEVK